MNLKNKFLAYRSDQHNAILHLSKGCNFVWQGESDPIKTAAIGLGILQQLDCTEENLTITILLYYLIDFIFWCLRHSKDPLQIDVPSETWPEREDVVKDLTKYPEAITVKEPDELSFKGIKKHQVISVVGGGKPKIAALKELLLRRSRKVKTVVIVDDSRTICTLIAELRHLSDDGLEVFLPNKKMNKENRTKSKQELSQSSDRSLVHIILSNQARRFDFQQVRLVVNYDMPIGFPQCYLRRMGLCRDVDAVNFVTGEDWFMLVDIQNEFKVNFEITSLYGPAGFCLREEQELAKNLNFPQAAQDIRHFACDCTDHGWKLTGFLEGIMAKLIKQRVSFS
ncbi:hypothetical protein AQUCO_05800043v1 [Aquilegia coerulea]|uniref:Helicase C-terminal domain-containing protein n=2 Tax=Aquilegia coerulea TaxID=218851 RepID=A0A2G5CED5_AQUCA|nr:hypothetical protein AQUCO_05800043v1 [Aquilegia coerulea]